jgi:hypothetical protein
MYLYAYHMILGTRPYFFQCEGQPWKNVSEVTDSHTQCQSAFFLLVKFCQEENFKIFKFQNEVILEILNHPKWETEQWKSPDFDIWFWLCSQNMKGWSKICTWDMVYSQIWLYLPMDDCHFGYKQKFLALRSFHKNLYDKATKSALIETCLWGEDKIWN